MFAGGLAAVHPISQADKGPVSGSPHSLEGRGVSDLMCDFQDPEAEAKRKKMCYCLEWLVGARFWIEGLL
ncbi:unnamed protein product [Rangifer tarandus platyrhynchus]|uniref:Uncharacterized protein n=2 Tax=Rangifer tarandus platyrhynchus TaxID=3082113 RepID=A0ACB0EZ96_RANTA|nr:unnamed protein product [Rangifer tarandus platyrhynchus]CAI9706035.1 unnamed protein product [Rangifer tarandus platyrhynchus]